MAFDNLNAVSEPFLWWRPLQLCLGLAISLWGHAVGPLLGWVALTDSKSDFPLVFLGRELCAVSKVRIWVLPPEPTNCFQVLGGCLSPTD